MRASVCWIGKTAYATQKRGVAECITKMRGWWDYRRAEASARGKSIAADAAYTTGPNAVNDLIRREREWNAIPQEEKLEMRQRNLPTGWRD